MITKEAVVELLKQVQDPEINMDIYSLGLIYNIDISEEIIHIDMTLTSPMCPYGPMIVAQVTELITQQGYKPEVELVWEPVWEPSDEIKMALGIL